MSRWAPQGNEGLSATELLDIELARRGPGGNLTSGFVKSNGDSLPNDIAPAKWILKKLLLSGEIEALAKIDCCLWRDSNIDKYALLVQFYPESIRGGDRNWVFAQHAKDLAISSYKAISDTLQHLGEEDLMRNETEIFRTLGWRSASGSF